MLDGMHSTVPPPSCRRLPSLPISLQYALVLLGLLNLFRPRPAFVGNNYCNADNYCQTTPSLAVDVVLFRGSKALTVHRRHPPVGRAIVGGFVEIGEACVDAARREVEEETGLVLSRSALHLVHQVFDEPTRDPRRHTVSLLYWAEAPEGNPRAGDDAGGVEWVERGAKTVFDHELLLDAAFADRERVRIKPQLFL